MIAGNTASRPKNTTPAAVASRRSSVVRSVGAPQDVFPAGPWDLRTGCVEQRPRPRCDNSGANLASVAGGAAGNGAAGRCSTAAQLSKIALRGEHQDRDRCDQEQVVGHLGSRAEHHIGRSARLLPASRDSPAKQESLRQRARLARSGRPGGREEAVASGGIGRGVADRAAETLAAVSFASSSSTGPERTGGEQRREADWRATGTRGGGGEASWRRRRRRIAASASSKRADGAERREQAVLELDPAKQRNDADEAGGDQENAGDGEQPRSDRIGSGRAGRLIGSVAQSRTALRA